MDFDKATAAHAEWKVKLRVALGDRAQLDAERICSDKFCDLGRWLHGDGRHQHGARPAFLQCVEAHRQFHEAAGGVARTINAGDYAKAEAELGAASAFAQASTGVAVALRRLRREVEGPIAA